LNKQKQVQSDGAKYKPFVLPGSSVQYAPDRPVDIQHVKLELTVDPEKKILNGNVHVQLVPLDSNVTRLEFDAVDLDIKSVKLSGDPVSFENTGQKLIVNLDTALKAESTTITIHYSGQPRRGLYFIGPDKTHPDRTYQVWTQGEDQDSRYWFPCYDSPNDRSTSEMIVTVPQKYTAISNGFLLETKENKAEGPRTFHWRQDIAHSSYLTSLVVGEFSIIREKVDDIELSYYVPKGKEEDAKRSFSKTPDMIRFFGEYFGLKYPYPKYAQVVVSDFIFGGMENISATTLTENTLHDKRAHLDFTSDDLVSHELAHQWWGDLITCRDWSHAWLNEGFATYCETLYKEHDLGKDETAIYQLQDLEQYMEEDRERYRRPIVSKNYFEPSELFDRHLYEKGGLVLHALRFYLGDDQFRKGFNNYANTFREKVVETSDFRRAMEDATGKSLEGFFDQWVYHAGHPEFKVVYSWDDNEKLTRLTVSQTQTGEGETPPVFQTPIEVSFTLTRGVETRRISITQREETFSFSLPGKPKDVEFDPGNWILKTLDFDKPKNMSLYQLENDKNSIGRIRAAARLAKQTGEDVIEALKSSMLKDSFWGVQAEAAKSLGIIRTTAALKVLLSALKVKHPKARRAVVKALGEFRDQDSAKALTALLDDGDESYYVEGEAARSLGKTKSPTAFEVLKKNLRKDSHNEAIRIGVFDGLAELENPQSIPLVLEWTLYGKPHQAREAATRALGKIGENKSEVSERLVELLEDPWFRVRIEAANGLGLLLEQKGLDPLNRLVDRELDGRVKRRAREAIRKIQAGRESSDEFRRLREDVDKLREENRQLRERLEQIETVPPKKH